MLDDDGFTLVELMITITIIAIIAAVAVPGLQRARLAGNESAAIGSVRVILSAETSYAATCGGGGYAQQLVDLGLAAPGGVPYVTPDLAAGNTSGYVFTVEPLAGSAAVLPAADTCNGSTADSIDAFHVVGVPETFGLTGQRSFASDNRGTVYQDQTGVPIPNPIPVGAQLLD